MIARDAKRLKTVQRFAVKRAALKATISSVHSSDEERREAMDKLKKLPREPGPGNFELPGIRDRGREWVAIELRVVPGQPVETLVRRFPAPGVIRAQ